MVVAVTREISNETYVAVVSCAQVLEDTRLGKVLIIAVNKNTYPKFDQEKNKKGANKNNLIITLFI